MRHTARLISLALASFGLCQAGCSSLKVHKVDQSHAADSPGSIVYALPKKTLLISATYVLTACKTEIDQKTNKPTLHLEAEITASVVGSNEPDSAERYLIPYSDLRSWTKDVEITVETYPNQTLKSLNGTITDQTGPVLTATATSLIKFAALGLTSAAAAKDEMCAEQPLKDLADIANYRSLLDDPNKKPTDAEAARYTKKIASIQADKLTTKVVMTWAPTLDEFKETKATKVLAASAAVDRWLQPRGRAFVKDHPDDRNEVNVRVDVPQVAHGRHKYDGTSNGIVVVDAALGTVRICRGKCPESKAEGHSVDNVLQVATTAFPQLGRKLLLPLQNWFLQTSRLEVALSEDGVITKLGVKTTSSAAATIGAAGGTIDALKSASDANEKAKAAAQTAAQTKARDDNKVLADCLDAQDKIVAKGGIPIGKCQ